MEFDKIGIRNGEIKMDYNEIQFEFVENDNIGLSKDQIEYIKKLIMHYIEKYPQVALKKVCDFFSWDYKKSELNEHTFTHNREDEEYIKYKSLAKYNDDDKLIGFNHIRLSKMELDNNQIVKWVSRDKRKFEKVKKSYERLQRQAKFLGQSIPDFNEILGQSFSRSELKTHEIEVKELTEEYFDVMLIRLMEEYNVIKRLVAHEFGHAIAYSYRLEEDEVIKSLYEKFKDGFEDIQEFIAECFMASELTNEITLANEVKDRINEVVGL